jgi:uncharacterized alkaline shock family protein YloU
MAHGKKQDAPSPSIAPDAVETPEITTLAETDQDDIVADFVDSDDNLDSEDSLTFSNGVIEKIVSLACRDVDGVVGMKGGFFNRVQETFTGTAPTKGVTVEVMPDSSVRVNISVLMEYGAYAPKVFEDVKHAVVRQIRAMTGLEVSGVNLRIEDVVDKDEIAAAQAAQEEEE